MIINYNLPHWHSLGSSRNPHSPQTSTETKGYLLSPITANVPIKSADFGLGEILQETSTNTSVTFQRQSGVDILNLQFNYFIGKKLQRYVKEEMDISYTDIH